MTSYSNGLLNAAPVPVFQYSFHIGRPFAVVEFYCSKPYASGGSFSGGNKLKYKFPNTDMV